MKRLCVILMTSAFLPWSLVSADIIHVPGDYPTIQEGIDACGEGDTVMVADGIYYENVIISTPISLIGENRDNTIVDGSGTGDVVFIEANNTLVSQFTMRNSGTEWQDAGIEIAIVDSCAIESCVSEDNLAGLFLHGSCYNSITRCRFDSNTRGIVFSESPGGPVDFNLANQIQNNIINANTYHGIEFRHMMPYHHSNTISGNLISNNGDGIYMTMSIENIISFNDLESNSDYGIALEMCTGGGDLNQFHHNNLLFNNWGLVQARDDGEGTDYWYSVSDNEGNHWSDYTGPDNDGDGIGDEPYYIDGYDQSQDLYPLMEPLYAIIQGGVSDGFEPIENVHVQAVGTEIDDYTGYDGIYSLEGLGAGNYDISFSHPVYRDTTVLGTPSTPDHTTSLDIVMNIETDTDEDNSPVPDNFALFQNYPNPFNATTSIKYTLPVASDVTIDIYNILGRRIETLVQGEQPAGYHQVIWVAADKPSGLYFYRIQAGEYAETRKMVLLK